MTTYNKFSFRSYPEQEKLFFSIHTYEHEGSFELNGFKVKSNSFLDYQVLAVTKGQGRIEISKSLSFGRSTIKFKSEKGPVVISGWVIGDFYWNRKKTLNIGTINASLHLT
ncbi:MAG: hypothetical protein QQN55_08625 [Nitrosopumilus sp.]